MCILLYVKVLWCSSIPYIYGQLEGSTSALSICAFCYMLNVFGVVVFPQIYSQLEDGGLGICAFCYMWIYGQLEGGTSAQSIYALCYMLNIFGVVVFHTSMVNWHGGNICPKYMCIVLHVKLIQCSGIT